MRELPEIVLVCVTRLSRGKFPGLNIHGYVKNKTKKAPMTFNVVISKGVLPPTVRQPITNEASVDKEFCYQQGPN